MDKGERISRFVNDLVGNVEDSDKIDPPSQHSGAASVVDHPYYRAYFQCWNEQRYYEAHDVLEQVWLNKDSEDDLFFKGLIQAAGAFVHLKLNFEQPTHSKHGRRLKPAVRLFALAEKNLSMFAPKHHALNVAALVDLLRNTREKI